MTSQLPRARTVDSLEASGAQSAPVSVRIDLDSCDMDAERSLQLIRRCDHGYEEGPSTATAALFIGLLMGAVSTTLIIWVATSVLSM